jgi:hypothetical protein
MANLKYYDSGSSEWKSLVIGKQGPVGPAGATGPEGPAYDVINLVSKTNGTVTTASTSSTVVRNITLSTSTPSGGIDGDVWLQYTP